MRRKKGLKLNDRLSELVAVKPKKIEEIYEQHTNSKYVSEDYEIVGKPNLMTAFSGIENQTYWMNDLANMSSNEFVMSTEKLAESAAANKKGYHTNLIKKMQANEYNRT